MLAEADAPAPISATSSRNEVAPMLMQTEVKLTERLQSAIDESPYLPRNTVRFVAHGGHVVMSGNVRTWYQKQMAQEILRRIDGVEGIENLLEVNWA